MVSTAPGMSIVVVGSGVIAKFGEELPKTTGVFMVAGKIVDEVGVMIMVEAMELLVGMTVYMPYTKLMHALFMLFT